MATVSRVFTQVISSCTDSLFYSCSSSRNSPIPGVVPNSKSLWISGCSESRFKKCFKSSFQLCIATTCSLSGWQPGIDDSNQHDRHACRLCSLETHASSASPFTEKYSPKRSYGKGLNSKLLFSAEIDSLRENEGDFGEFSQRADRDLSNLDNPIDCSVQSSQLPELREVLTMLRKRRELDGDCRKKSSGNVFLVGTGPGDPELLTMKALRLMQTADLVLYDRLVSTDILDLVHAGARLLYVGKTSGFHSRTQGEIHELLLNFAEAGATVVRLKGGDPLVFGRGGEELDFLQEQGIQVKVVPGITAASGIAAELGIPLTHRGAANSVRFLTGHSRKGGDDPLYVAKQAADPDSTLVIYMGLATLPGLAEKLIVHGLSPDTPAAAVERGTTPQQRTVFSTLATLPLHVSQAGLVSPTLIFIGRVVALSPLWPFDDKAATKQDYFLNGSMVASPTYAGEKDGQLEREPRDRWRRGPDPALPSQY